MYMYIKKIYLRIKYSLLNSILYLLFLKSNITKFIILIHEHFERVY